MAPNTSEPFTLVSTQSSNSLAPDYVDITSARIADTDIQITKSLREHYPELCITIVPEYNAPLLAFAAAGFASVELDTKTDSIFRWRGFVPADHRGGTGQLGDAVFFAKYHYTWGGNDFILYTVANGGGTVQYILKEPDATKGEDPLSNCAVTDGLIATCAKEFLGDETDFVWIYDDYWYRSRELWEEVQKASWNDVILDPKMKKTLTSVTKNFFDSKEIYKRYSVPWKRGLIFYGPPGNGKTISIKALMKELSARESNPIPTLYVKYAPYTYDIGEVFSFARSMSPCMLVLEDVETIVTQDTRSYFFNEVDGLGNNDGILMVASTNYLDRLDSGLSKRPSRFDRKYKFPLPSSDEREEYAQYWRQKLAKSNPSIDFPKKMCRAIAKITYDFSFAYIQEAFIAALLTLAREDQDDGDGDEDDDTYIYDVEVLEPSAYDDLEAANVEKDKPLSKNRLWIAMKRNVKMLRKDLEDKDGDDDDDDDEDKEGFLKYSDSKSTRAFAGHGLLSGHSRNPNRGTSHQRPRAIPFERELPERPAGRANMIVPQAKREPSHWSTGRFAQESSRNEPTFSTHMSGGRLNYGPRGPTSERRAIPREFVSRYRGSVGGGFAARENSEPSQAAMAGAGVRKGKMIAETAYETASY